VLLKPKLPLATAPQTEHLQLQLQLQIEIDIIADAQAIHARCDELRADTYLLCLAMQRADIRYNIHIRCN
jgi:hypothetical protein